MKRTPVRTYVDYLKDNPKGYWFKRKLFGYGWTPATREGWLATLAFIVLVIAITVRGTTNVYTDAEAIRQVVIPVVILLVLFLFICFMKGQPLKWQWGLPEKNQQDDD